MYTMLKKIDPLATPLKLHYVAFVKTDPIFTSRLSKASYLPTGRQLRRDSYNAILTQS